MTVSVEVPRPLRASECLLPPGRYTVELEEARDRCLLAGESVECEVALARRASKMAVSSPSAQLRPVRGEARMLLVLRVPPASEWTASLDEA